MAMAAGLSSDTDVQFDLSETNGSFNVSRIDQVMLPIELDPWEGLLNPGFYCKNCTILGHSGVSGSSTSSHHKFFDDGTVDIGLSDIFVDMNLDVDLNTGFEPFDIFLPVLGYELPRVHIGDDFGIAVTAAIGFPIDISIEFNDPVKISVGFIYKLLDSATIHIDVKHPRKSTISGVSHSGLTVKPFNISDPGLKAEVSTGLSLRLEVQTFGRAGARHLVGIKGKVEINLNLVNLEATYDPIFGGTNADCVKPPSGTTPEFKSGANVSFHADSGISSSGAMELEFHGMTHTWERPFFPSLDHAWKDIPSQCIVKS